MREIFECFFKPHEQTMLELEYILLGWGAVRGHMPSQIVLVTESSQSRSESSDGGGGGRFNGAAT